MITILKKTKEIAKNDVEALSKEETKHYLTPFAFTLDKSLFGLPLASPTKRGIALLIDFSLIALLSEVSGVALALAVAITLYYLGNKKRSQNAGKTTGRKRRKIMRIIAAMMVFVVLLDTLPPLLKYFNVEENESQLNASDHSFAVAKSMAFTATVLSAIQTISDSSCQKLNCWQTALGTVAEHAALVSFEGDIAVTKTQLNDLFSDIVAEIELPINEHKQLIASMHDSYNKKFSSLASDEVIAKSNLTVKPSDKKNAQIKEASFVLGKDGQLTDIAKQQVQEKANQPGYSIIAWIKGIIEDLGLGFGWATFYFTAFIALGKGQTLGKKLVGIKVLQLDGTPLSLWDSFGRYGGYGAGLATGLLGFIQIYWDANRQAIHDKISATVVIDIRKARLTQTTYRKCVTGSK